MKLRLLLIVLFLLFPLTATHSSRRHRRTLSPAAKKPASLAGFLHLTLCISHLTALFLLTVLLSRPPTALQLTIQTPSSC
jgi:hypothetical protein